MKKKTTKIKFDRMAKAKAEKYSKKTNESFRKCWFWANAELLQEYEIIDESKKNESA